ncbi:hypothetical protein [Candidatus Lokiarchaeum ossiferum]|uniref:hypothetical protein n=1 Tax=Candidatus Lokiarchaeum ossiferum TaxID=2951803 RepID=UPI00352D4B30
MTQLIYHNRNLIPKTQHQKKQIASKFGVLGVFLIFFMYILLFLGKSPPYPWDIYGIIILVFIGLYLLIGYSILRRINSSKNTKWTSILFQENFIQIEMYLSATGQRIIINKSDLKKIKLNYIKTDGNQGHHLSLIIKAKSKTYRFYDFLEDCDSYSEIAKIHAQIFCYSKEYYQILPKTNMLGLKAAFINTPYSQMKNYSSGQIVQLAISTPMKDFFWIKFLIYFLKGMWYLGLLLAIVMNFLPVILKNESLNWSHFVIPSIAAIFFIVAVFKYFKRSKFDKSLPNKSLVDSVTFNQ